MWTSRRSRASGIAPRWIGAVLKGDFERAVELLRVPQAEAADRRALVRCFGSVIDGLANTLRTMAEVICTSEGRQNELLRVEDSGAAISATDLH